MKVIEVMYDGNEFVAVLSGDEDAIVGLGHTKEEAIANCVVGNQVDLGLEFQFV